MSKYERKAQSQRKHGPLSVSGASKAPAPPPINRPDWKGPGYVKKKPLRQPTPSKSSPALTVLEQPLPVSLQQLVLDVFRDTFPAAQDLETLKPNLFKINNALLQNDLNVAFGSDVFRECYAVRWCPSRSLTYANIMAWLCNQNSEMDLIRRLLECSETREDSQLPHNTTKVVCFGGGAAEVMAFAALLRHIHPDTAGKPAGHDSSRSQTDPEDTHPDRSATSHGHEMSPQENVPAISELGLTSRPGLLDVRLVDSTDWSSITTRLMNGLNARPVLSKYASATARASNAAFLSAQTLNLVSSHTDVFDLSIEDLRIMIGSHAVLLTLFFTLNDLYVTSIPRTTAFLRKVTMAAPQGSLLLVVDNRGACVEVEVPSVTKKQPHGGQQSYDLQWLMDRVLLDTGNRGDEEQMEVKSMWEKIVDERNKHHKLNEKLRYASLENIKFQFHMFRRL
ncbi:hypothetical protein MBLNU459_g7625t1 [Dothideomycetes sp. NU459]